MNMKSVREGEVEISVPDGRIYDASVFYNMEGELNRDISVCALQVFQKEFGKKIEVCDALSASGIRGIRYAKEVGGIKSVTLNDKNPSSAKLIKKNVTANNLAKKCIITNEDASLLMRKKVFVAIDIDPFGSPSIFMDSAARSVYHKGFLGVTATDQSALAGTYPESCFRKYGIKTTKTIFYNELGVRILTSFIISSMARYDRAFIPVMSFADQHYYRVFGRIEHAGEISGLLKQFKYLSTCSCGRRDSGIHDKCECGRKFNVIGPVYLGNISEKKFCKDVMKDLSSRKFRMKKEEEKLLRQLIDEAEMPPLYYDLHALARLFKTEPPKMDMITEKLAKKGFKVSRTHFSPTAIKTDAGLDDIKSAFEKNV